MNYGKNRTSKKEKELLSKSGMARKKFRITFLKAFLICFLAAIVIGIVAVIGIVRNVIKSAPDIDDIDATPTGYLSTVLDSDGNETATLVASGSNRVYVTIDEIPLDLQHAFVAIEDERFYDHNGIDIQGIARAAFKGITSGHFSEGASTITQQLLKNNVFTTWTSESNFSEKLKRKLQEQYLAIQLEKSVNKDWILENYLNSINLGQNTLGVQAASKRYFNKDVSDLNISECAVIAAITQNPSRYNPVSNPDENAKRRKKVLNDMLEQEYISEKEYDTAIEDDVYERIQIVNLEVADDNVTSYFVDALTDQVLQALIDEKGYTETQAYKALYSGGLTIYSTQDSTLQSICDEEVNNPENYVGEPQCSFSYRLTVLKKNGTYENYSEQTMLSYYQAENKNYTIDFPNQEDAAAAIEEYKNTVMEPGDTIPEGGEKISYTLQPQAALTLLDQSTGEVKALVGGRGEKTASKTLNRATSTPRQPGSTFKIIAAYAPALDSSGMSLATVQDDAPYSYANGTSLRNYNGRYLGFTTIRKAITNSINVVTVKTLTEIGTQVGYDYLSNFGFTTIVPEDNTQSLCLGGLTKGVYNLELTAAYATIANGGTYTKPRFFTKILDHDGNVLIDNTPQTHTVLKDTTAWLLTSAMKDVMTSGTGVAANISNMPVAGKSGTTTKDRDSLFAGFTPYYTCVVWGGYDDNAPLSNTRYTKNVWRSVMQRVNEGLEPKDFEQPSGIVTATVCKKSGKLAVSGICDCDPRGNQAYTEYFASGTVPTEICDHHVQATICTISGMIANEFCPEETKQTGIYIIGGSPNSDDGAYLFSEGLSDSICTLHTAESVLPVLPDNVDDILNDTQPSEREDPEEDHQKPNDDPDDQKPEDSQDNKKPKPEEDTE
ncbi:MAG: PBP1A family penicillin-binding protein [Lachnospiraceae bacterium]|nr:PBP1A family penicillin-binding protein [Lachnospiraceae bacterium]